MSDATIEFIKWIIGICLAGGGVLGFAEFLISRRDKKKEKTNDQNGKLDKILENQKELSKDQTRTNLLLMISCFPKNHYEILCLAQKYFVDLHGNWYMGTEFSGWLKQEGIEKPDWYLEK